MKRWGLIASALFCCVYLNLPACLRAATFTGSEVCSECHKSEFGRHKDSHHAEALRPITASPIYEVLLRLGHSPENRITYQRVKEGVEAREEGLTQRATLEWVFGAGAQGITPVGRIGDQYFEHQFSFYTRGKKLGPTFGHPAHVSTPLAELGVLQDKRTISQCFNCHATAVQLVDGLPDTAKLDPGVQCERCHGPGSAHIEAARARANAQLVKRELVNPGKFPARAQIELCGQCHRLPTPDSGDEPELEDPVNVRFAPIGLLASRCFRTSQSLSCLTCHDPHANARPRSDLFYTQQCLRCHAATLTVIMRCRRVEKQNCLPCHMPQTALSANLRFTDHRIRIR